MKFVLGAVSVFAGLSLSLSAQETNTCYLVKPADYAVIDWLDDANYDTTQGGKPSDGGVLDIRVPNGSKILLDEASLDQIKDFLAIRPPINGELVLSNDVDKVLNCAFTDMGSYRGGVEASALVVKRGRGRITLTSNHCRLANADSTEAGRLNGPRLMDFSASWTIEDGCVDFPNHDDALGSVGWRLQLGNVHLATTQSVLGVGRMMYSSSGAVYPQTITGIGTVRLSAGAPADKGSQINLESSCTFGGRVEGNMGLWIPGASRTLTLTNTTSTALSTDWNNFFCAYGGATLAFASFGRKGQPSSLGASDEVLIDFGGRLLYLGKGETTDKTVRMRVDNRTEEDEAFVIDAGETGGLVFDAASSWYAINDGERHLTIRGNGTNVMRGAVRYGDTVTKNELEIAKSGAGSWMFERERGYWGAWYVREGELGFDSLDETGTACALGTAAKLATWNSVGRQPTEYAFELGNTNGCVPMLTFNGTNLTWCSTRLVSLIGDGGFRNDSACDFRFSGVRSFTGGKKNLHLGGTNASGSEIAGIADSEEHAVSIVKEGPGTWTLNGSNVLHGAISVREGTLKVRRDSDVYTWFKFVIRGEMGPNFSHAYQSLQELVICDADGNRLNKNLTWSGFAEQSIRPGEVALPRRTAMQYGYRRDEGQEDIKYIFDGSAGGTATWRVAYNKPGSEVWGMSDSRVVCKPDNPATWIPVVMHLTNTTETAAKYEVVQRFGNGTKSDGDTPGDWTMYGSVDGLHWDELSVTNQHVMSAEMTGTGGANQYASTTKLWSGEPATYAGGYPIRGRTLTPPTFTVMDDVKSISVAQGAQFLCEGAAPTVRGLVVDAAGAGLVSNVAFAAEGAFEVTGVDTHATSVKLPGTYVGVTGLENLAVGDWTLSVNDSETLGGRYSVSVRDGEITLNKKGLVLIVR